MVEISLDGVQEGWVEKGRRETDKQTDIQVGGIWTAVLHHWAMLLVDILNDKDNSLQHVQMPALISGSPAWPEYPAICPHSSGTPACGQETTMMDDCVGKWSTDCVFCSLSAVSEYW